MCFTQTLKKPLHLPDLKDCICGKRRTDWMIPRMSFKNILRPSHKYLSSWPGHFLISNAYAIKTSGWQGHIKWDHITAGHLSVWHSYTPPADIQAGDATDMPSKKETGNLAGCDFLKMEQRCALIFHHTSTTMNVSNSHSISTNTDCAFSSI